MATETELKMLVPEEDIERLKSELSDMAGTAGEHKMLQNQYYDTPSLTLSGAKVALRIRRDGEAFIQTFKTQGRSINGLHQRQEWEWALATPHLDLQKLTEVEWPEALDKAQLQDQLLAIFSTDFTRTLWDIQWQGSELEVVIDQGCVVFEDPDTEQRYQEPICEVEIELKRGAEAAINSFAQQLQQQIPSLVPSDISKAQRGYRLFDCARNG